MPKAAKGTTQGSKKQSANKTPSTSRDPPKIVIVGGTKPKARATSKGKGRGKGQTKGKGRGRGKGKGAKRTVKGRGRSKGGGASAIKSPRASARSRSPRGNRKKGNTQSKGQTTYYIDGEPTSDPNVAKFLSRLFEKGYKSKTEDATQKNKFKPWFLKPKIKSHKGHPQQFTQIFVPGGQQALMTQPSDFRLPNDLAQAKSPYIVFNNNIENHGHLVLNQGQGQTPNAHGEGPINLSQIIEESEPLRSGLEVEEPKHIFQEEQVIEIRKTGEGVTVEVAENSFCSDDVDRGLMAAQSPQELEKQNYQWDDDQGGCDQNCEGDCNMMRGAEHSGDCNVVGQAEQFVTMGLTRVQAQEQAFPDDVWANDGVKQLAGVAEEQSGQLSYHSEDKAFANEDKTIELHMKRTITASIESADNTPGTDNTAQRTQEMDDRSKHLTPSEVDELPEDGTVEFEPNAPHYAQFPGYHMNENEIETLRVLDEHGNPVETFNTSSGSYDGQNQNFQGFQEFQENPEMPGYHMPEGAFNYDPQNFSDEQYYNEYAYNEGQMGYDQQQNFEGFQNQEMFAGQQMQNEHFQYQQNQNFQAQQQAHLQQGRQSGNFEKVQNIVEHGGRGMVGNLIQEFEQQSQANLAAKMENQQQMSNEGQGSSELGPGEKYVYKDEQVVEIRSEFTHGMRPSHDVTRKSNISEVSGEEEEEEEETINERTRTFQG